MKAEWEAVKETDVYKKSGLMQRHSIRKSFFNEFIKKQPEFPKDEDQARQLEETFTTDFKEKVPKAEDEETPWGKLGESKFSYALKTGAWGTAHTTANTLDTLTLGAAKHLGFSDEGVEKILENRGVEQPAIARSKGAGSLVGYGALFSVTYGLGGGAATTAALTKTRLVTTGVTGLGRVKTALVPLVNQKWLARAAGWAVAGFEVGAGKELVKELDDAIKTKDPDALNRLKAIGIAGAEEAAYMASAEMLFAGLAFGGTRFLKSKAGLGLLNSVKKLGTKSEKVLTHIGKEWGKRFTKAGRRIARVAKAEGKTYDDKLAETIKVLVDEADRLPTAVEAAAGRTWQGEGVAGQADVKPGTAVVLDAFGRPADLNVALDKPAMLRTAQDRVTIQKASGQDLVKPGASPKPDAVIKEGVGITRSKDVAKVKVKAPVVSSKIEVTPKPTRPSKMTSDQRIAMIKDMAEKTKSKRVVESTLTPDLKSKLDAARREKKLYMPDSWYHVEYQSANGAKKSMMSGNRLNEIAADIKAGVLPKDSGGVPIVKLLDTYGASGSEAGFIINPDYHKMVVNLTGLADEAGSSVQAAAKSFGAPFMIGQKYPAFKPIYMAVQDSVDKKTELFTLGASILNPKKLRKLSPASKAKVTSVIKYGNRTDVKKWFTDMELATQHGLNANEVSAYKAIRKAYKYGLDMEVKSRKLLYLKEHPGSQISDDTIKSQVAQLEGYVSQQRLDSKWAVYAPPEPGKDTAKFFNLYKTKFQAQEAAKQVGGTAYLRKNINSQVGLKTLSVNDLENLVEASGVDANSLVVKKMREELRKRGFSSHWVQRKDVPGYEWNFDNVVGSAVDYIESSANKFTRIQGRGVAEEAFRNGKKTMSSELKQYARNFMDTYYNSGSVGIRWLNRLMYTNKLAFKTSFLAQNLTQPIATTYPALAQYFPGVQTEGAFLSSYRMAQKYTQYKLKGAQHGLPADLTYILSKLQRQGVLGDQLTRFQLGASNLKKEQFEQWVGLFGRAGEYINRTHAAISGYKAGVKTGLTDKKQLLAFAKEFVYKTQFAYGKQNLPLQITGAGNVKNLIRTMYTFKHYTVNAMQLLNSQMPWRGAPMRQTVRALGAMTAQAGIKGLPFASIIGVAYKAMTGDPMDKSIRETLANWNVPDKVIDLALHGAYSTIGIDASNLVGLGDVIPTYGGALQSILGAPAGYAAQLGKGVMLLSQGDARGLEYLAPDVIRNAMKGYRYAKEGMRNLSNELIATPSKYDSVLRGLGFPSMTESKAYAAREAKQAAKSKNRDLSSEVHRELAWAKFNKDHRKYREIVNGVKRHNKKVEKAGKPEEKIRYNSSSVDTWLSKMRGRDVNVPRQLRGKTKDINELYDLKR